MSKQDKNAAFAFVKYSELRFLQELQKGDMYFNTIQYFAKAEESDGIGDRYENVYKQTFGATAQTNLRKEFHNSTIKMIRLPDGKYRSTYINDDFYANFFCLYSIMGNLDFDGHKDFLLSAEMKQTYDHFLLILNPKEFLNRVKTVLEGKVKQPHYAFIKYSDIDSRSGKKEYFEKPLRYSYQNEFRIAFQNTQEKAEVISIGSIEDISIILSVDECNRITLHKNKNDLLERIDKIRERHLMDCVTKHFNYEDLKNKIGRELDDESLSTLENAERELLTAQRDFYKFYDSLRIS